MTNEEKRACTCYRCVAEVECERLRAEKEQLADDAETLAIEADGLRAELARYITLAEVREIEADRLRDFIRQIFGPKYDADIAAMEGK